MLDDGMFLLNAKFAPDQVRVTSAEAEKFAPGHKLPADLVFKGGHLKRRLQEYLDTLPSAIQEGIRSTLYSALTSDPPRPVLFKWEAAYDNELRITQTPDTSVRGSIGLTLRSRYPVECEDEINESRSKSR
jgi:hypothetical protein